MASVIISSTIFYPLILLAALFRPVRAEIYITGSPAGIAVGSFCVLLLIIGGGITACVCMAKRKRTGPPPMFAPQPHLPQEQVPILAPPKGPFIDAAAVPANAYLQAQLNTGYAPQNTGGYALNPQYPNPYPQASTHSTSNVSLGAYPGPHAGNMNPTTASGNPFSSPPGPPPSVNQNPFSPPAGPPPV
ncbi:hypothetical protein C8F04DRAFT_1395727 [Mycena alexandri]|uniref:Uncharacterized protein n=1 Tax=Mycena alexandri TaxID=1745969 RepID=A0AAD6X6L4_9AGAR|nr:hypothetical protein C8F04DRAFT_1395727 [Mycena alexandri]